MKKTTKTKAIATVLQENEDLKKDLTTAMCLLSSIYDAYKSTDYLSVANKETIEILLEKDHIRDLLKDVKWYRIVFPKDGDI